MLHWLCCCCLQFRCEFHNVWVRKTPLDINRLFVLCSDQNGVTESILGLCIFLCVNIVNIWWMERKHSIRVTEIQCKLSNIDERSMVYRFIICPIIIIIIVYAYSVIRAIWELFSPVCLYDICECVDDNGECFGLSSIVAAMVCVDWPGSHTERDLTHALCINPTLQTKRCETYICWWEVFIGNLMSGKNCNIYALSFGQSSFYICVAQFVNYIVCDIFG